MAEFDLDVGAAMRLYHGDDGLMPTLQIAGGCQQCRLVRENCPPPRARLRARVRPRRARRLPHRRDIPLARALTRQIRSPAEPFRAPLSDLRALQSKDGNSDDSNKRFRVMLSDGQHYVTAMLSSQLNPLVLDGKLEKFTVVKLTEYLCQTINNRK